MDRRPIAELITLIFALSICACIFAAIIGVVLISVLEPGTEVGAAASSLGTLISAITGFIIGRAFSTGRNGGSRDRPEDHH